MGYSSPLTRHRFRRRSSRDLDGVIELDTEVAMSEQELHRSQIGCPAM
jgi:hypothetical protein